MFPSPQRVNRAEGTHHEMSVQVNAGQEKTEEETFEEPFLFSDITLEVEGRKLHAHRAILSMWSPVFKAMFTNSFKESSDSNVKLPDDNFEDIQELLHFLYTPGGREMDAKLALNLLPTVHRYQVDVLLRAIENRLIGSMSEANVFEYLRLAQIYDISGLQTAAIERVSRVDIDYLNSELKEQTVPLDIQLQIFKRRVTRLEDAILDIFKSFQQPCLRVESRMERRPANHCPDHNQPLARTEDDVPCAQCVDTFKGHITELCRRALNRRPTVASKETGT